MLTVKDIYTMAAALIGDHDDNTVSGTPMTVRDVYAIAAAFIGDREDDDNDERDFAPIYMKVLLQEALPAENSIRKANGSAELTIAPTPGIDDTIPYSDKIVRGALPYGLAWQYHQDAGNLGLASQYRNMFIEGVENAKKTIRGYVVPYMNILMQEALNAENSIRINEGKKPFKIAPFVESLDDEVAYHDSIAATAFPFGLAWQFHQNAGNLQLATQYRGMFEDAVNKNYCFSMRKY